MPLIDPNHIFNAWSAVFGVQRWGLGFLLCVNVACWCLDAEGTGFFGSCHGCSFAVVVLVVACPVMRFVAAAVAVSRCGSVLSVIADVVIQLA
jgi:hypothetical protein